MNKPLHILLMKTKFDLLAALLITAIIVCLTVCINFSFLNSGYGSFNSKARLAYTNTASVITFYNMEYNKDFPDGIYSGSLKEPVINMNISENTEFTDHYDYLHKHLNSLMGGKEDSGYYCTVIMNNAPVASYWSKSSVAAEYSEQLGIIAQNDLKEYGKIQGFKFGAYPKENRDSYKYEISLDHTGNKLPLYYDPRIKPSIFGIYDKYSDEYFDLSTFIMVIAYSHIGHILIVLLILLILRIRALWKRRAKTELSSLV